jgi:hypothetical protein
MHPTGLATLHVRQMLHTNTQALRTRRKNGLKREFSTNKKILQSQMHLKDIKEFLQLASFGLKMLNFLAKFEGRVSASRHSQPLALCAIAMCVCPFR